MRASCSEGVQRFQRHPTVTPAVPPAVTPDVAPAVAPAATFAVALADPPADPPVLADLRELERGPFCRPDATEFGNSEVRVYSVTIATEGDGDRRVTAERIHPH